ncbi:class I SAM-dependent methyltransferase [Vibrio algarum]|uniref:Class I SAM-dependent methyltransferase n=1 Tax=Vibrio algarum TaxID=3020714 RepID=A0ABT4YMY0_9VIBR|nr:class I SAM-dependent methyltransferase [Vibrio sp. KJ40-1]MDB1122518.1 class I SAM-dependent methyltransferase [Vibrio sp. KJ40-1]
MQPCPLCDDDNVHHYYNDKKRDYLQCTRCNLVFVPTEQRLDTESEKAQYDKHENDPSDEGYRCFLSRLSEPLMEKISPNSAGLDFGCGPGPTLSVMLQDSGHNMTLYDIYYYPDIKALDKTYDFLTATEVIEHLYYPKDVWQNWLNLVKPNGWIGLMTKLVINVEAFSKWHYKNDITHVCFYSRETFQYLAERDKLQLEFVGNDVILLRKLQ